MQHLRSIDGHRQYRTSEQSVSRKKLSEMHIVDRVRKAVEMLPLNQRQVITLVDLEENSYVQVSEILEIPIGTVMSRLNRGRKQLKSRLIGINLDSSNGSIPQKHLKRLV